MYTYIKHNIKGFYVELETKLSDELYKTGNTWEDFLANKWVLLTKKQVAFRNENPTAKISEVFNTTLDTTSNTKTLESVKNQMYSKIDSYDNSDAVNQFTVNDELTGWFTPTERANYKTSVDAAKLLNVDLLQFYMEDVLLDVNTTDAETMLAQIQLYADRCFIVTKQHKAAVEALTSIEDVEAYDYTKGYPDKLNFTL